MAAGETRRSIGRAPRPPARRRTSRGSPRTRRRCAVVNLRGSPGRWNDACTRICVPSCDSSRSKRGRSGSSPKRSSIICGSTMTRRPLSSGRRSLASSPRTSMPTRRGPWFSNRASRRTASRSGRRVLVLADEERAGQERRARVGVEQRDGERRRRRPPPCPTGFDLQAVLDLLGSAAASAREATRRRPVAPLGGERRRACGGAVLRRRLHATSARPLAAPSLPFDARPREPCRRGPL